MNEYLNICVSEDTLDVQALQNEGAYKKYPLLKQFVGHEAEISQPQYISDGEEGVVFSFRHENMDLCLKLFKTWEFPKALFPVQPTSAKLLGPFSRECRAFARLCDLGLNGTWAVRCHGWIYLTDDQLACLSTACKRLRLVPGSNVSRWAIVKDFVPSPPRKTDLPEIRAKFEIAKQALILPGDVEARNYRASFFVDLGSTSTYPLPKPWWSKFEFERFFRLCPPKVGERWSIEP
ncbi:uncharacterized protein BO72DRAFT_176652 [Aspergillus fijiensis CBS 313.89]|uniref:Uncharacterized protein n=1 Tax=Aspergillus fijiensis CBS 313.89 TaxID=1448319 RepID=A0A8G1W2P1_9EURO|nr:uncharacterized protein BO72DRAFT_176652 [Aspergillus fijiensis CBS 313.89]RAK81692.1 hypothetical protein BO72DRAFT_176652 [Aspergillus fijiensis CBS 313.89]